MGSRRRAHVVAVPYPAQGHVIPLLELSQCLASNGIKVTFVNTHFNHSRILHSLSARGQQGGINDLITLASVPDGLEPWEDRNDLGKLAVSLPKAMLPALEALIEKINREESDAITCAVIDYSAVWALPLAQKLGIKKSAFTPGPVAMLALCAHCKTLLDQGIVDQNGTPLKEDHVIQLLPEMPSLRIQESLWLQVGDFTTQQQMFQAMPYITRSEETVPDWVVCNSSQELEGGALQLLPQCNAVGPLLASTRLGESTGSFWEEDSDSLSWLDQQQPNSTIYISFGSFTLFQEKQFHELALGLELCNRPFLWVVRKDMTQDIEKSYPEGFKERVKDRAMMVDWAPQQKVLSHPSVGCFLSHCGWNSTMEGVCNGVPFLCWPYFADQFLNRNYIVECWRVGLSLDKDESGVVGSGEVVKKVGIVMSDGRYRERVMELRSKALCGVAEGGSSHKNMNSFVDWIKGD